jgi:hypothetical protein
VLAALEQRMAALVRASTDDAGKPRPGELL